MECLHINKDYVIYSSCQTFLQVCHLPYLTKSFRVWVNPICTVSLPPLVPFRTNSEGPPGPHGAALSRVKGRGRLLGPGTGLARVNCEGQLPWQTDDKSATACSVPGERRPQSPTLTRRALSYCLTFNPTHTCYGAWVVVANSVGFKGRGWGPGQNDNVKESLSASPAISPYRVGWQKNHQSA